ncbi:MAG: AraC family transcriptional regulator [Rhodospirillales bacterium]|nr:AraC family transcriptional regulator [Rhodospirillales bacterium]
MKTIFSTAQVHPRDRFDCWHSVACKDLVPHDSKPENRETFQAELRSSTLARIGLILFKNSPMKVSHTARHIALAGNDNLFICRQFGGETRLEQYNRQVVLETGDFLLLDPRIPYAGTFSEGSQLLVLKVPRALMEARIGQTREVAAYGIKPLSAETNLISTHIALLSTKEEPLSTATEWVVERQVLDLVAIALNKLANGGRPRLSSARSLVRMTIRAAVEELLTDPLVNAEKVAAAAGISVRYANSVLAEEDTSIARLIQSKRLEHCRAALEDPLQAHRKVSDVAYGWGFSDMTHFGRKFREAYGLLPSEYRHHINNKENSAEAQI